MDENCLLMTPYVMALLSWQGKCQDKKIPSEIKGTVFFQICMSLKRLVTPMAVLFHLVPLYPRSFKEIYRETRRKIAAAATTTSSLIAQVTLGVKLSDFWPNSDS